MEALLDGAIGLFGGGSGVVEERRRKKTEGRQRDLQRNMRANIGQNSRKVTHSMEEAARHRRQATLYMKQGNRAAAARSLRHAKMAESRANNTDNRSFALEAQADALDTAVDMKRDFSTMQATAKETRGLISGIDEDGIEDMMHDVTDTMTEMNNIQSTFNEKLDFGGILGTDAEIDNELDELLEAEEGAEMDQLMYNVETLPDPPTTLPVRAGTGPSAGGGVGVIGDGGTRRRAAVPVQRAGEGEEDFSEFAW